MERTSTLLNRERYEQIISSPQQQALSDRILHETDEKKQDKLKSQLAAVMWMAKYPADSHRPKKSDAVPSGLCFHDFDHLEKDPKLVYEEQIKPHIEELGIGIVKLSARGNGLHVISLVPDGWTTEQTQIWVAEKCGLAKYRDRACIDLSRLAFVSSWGMHLYYEPKTIWDDRTRMDPHPADPPLTLPQREGAADARESVLGGTKGSVQGGGSGSGAGHDASVANAVQVPTSIPLMYDASVSYAELVPRIIDHYGGLPRSFGGRHEAFKKFAFALASVMDYDAHVVMHYLQPYQQQVDTVQGHPFSVDEVHELVLYACQKKTFSQSREVRQALVECRPNVASNDRPEAEEEANSEAAADEGDESEEEITDFLAQLTKRPRKMPKPPGELATLVALAPDPYREAMAMAAMSPLMTLADGVTYEDLMSNQRFLASHTVIVGPPSTNKGKIIRQTELLLDRQLKREEEETKKVEANKKEIRAAERSNSTREVKEYEPEVRILPPATSINEYLKIQHRAGEQTLFMYTPEIANMAQACNSGSWADLRNCFREGWDGDYHGQLRSTTNSFSGRVRLRLNVLSVGTPGQAFGYRERNGRWKSGFYESKENGLASRLMIVYMPCIIGERLMKWKKLSVEELSRVEKMTLMLETETGELFAKRLHNTMLRWNEEMRLLTLRVGGGIIDEGRKRAAVNGLACGYLAYLLEGRKDNVVVSNWARYCADLCLRNYLLAYVGQENNGAALMPNASNHTAPIQDLLSALPETFTIRQAVEIRLKQGKSENLKSLLSRLTKEGLIESMGKKSGIYRKVKK